MDPRISDLERAFQLARSGDVAAIEDIRKTLKREGYDSTVVGGGPLLRRQLRRLIDEALERKAAPRVLLDDP